jgi:adenosylhomocysteine nucleosidase
LSRLPLFAQSLLIAASLLAAPVAIAKPAAPAQFDKTPRTLVITAFEPEWVALEGAVKGAKSYHMNGLTFLTGSIAGKPVILMESGVSMVNAAMNTQLALDHFNAKRIIFSGIAGGIDPHLSVGDVVVAERWNQYMEVSLGRKKGDSYVSPDLETPDQLPAYGMLIPRDVRVGNAAEKPVRHRWFMADPALLAVARKMAPTLSLQSCLAKDEPIPQTKGISPDAGRCLDTTPRIVVGGQGISGPAFADNAEYREYLYATFKAQVLDMETAATAHVAYANQVPFIAFRSLSDLAGGDTGPNRSWIFGRLAARNAATVVTRYLAALPD